MALNIPREQNCPDSTILNTLFGQGQGGRGGQGGQGCQGGQGQVVWISVTLSYQR